MLTIDKVSVYGFEESVRGMRNPFNSWSKSDSRYCNVPRTDALIDDNEIHLEAEDHVYLLGCNDATLMNQLVKAGPSHRKFMRMIVVYMDIVAPLYWWKEYDTYKIGTVSNSCSTMHKITAKKFEREDFSTDKLTDFDCLDNIIASLNKNRDLYLKTHDKQYWWQIIQTLPSSYNQKRTVMLSYEVLRKIYNERNNHKLYEWLSFCKKIRELPNSWLITGGRLENENEHI